jgi:hypothetical protein
MPSQKETLGIGTRTQGEITKSAVGLVYKIIGTFII